MATVIPILLGALETTVAGTSLTVGTLLSAGTAAVSGVVGAQAASAGAAAASQSAKFNAQVAANNAELAFENAEESVFESGKAALDQDLAAGDQLGAILAQSGASGLSLDSASIQGRRLSLERLATKDRGRIRDEGEIRANRSRQQGRDFLSQELLSKAEGKSARRVGKIGVGVSLISGAGQVGGVFARRAA